MKRLTVATLTLLSLTAMPAGGAEPTATERAAEECENPSVVAEFGHGSRDYCYDAMLDEINPGAPRKLEIFEDGGGVLYLTAPNPADWQEIRTFAPDTFTWDCATMGNRQCGPSVLPRTT